MNGLSMHLLIELWFRNDRFEKISVCNLNGMVGYKSDMGFGMNLRYDIIGWNILSAWLWHDKGFDVFIRNLICMWLGRNSLKSLGEISGWCLSWSGRNSMTPVSGSSW